MSLFGGLFGKGKSKPPSPQEAIQRLRDVEEMLQKKSDFLEQKVESEITLAKKHGTKNKRIALQALKRKKRYEKQLQQIDGTLSTIEFQREALENASTNTEVLKVMGNAAQALKSTHKNMNVDDVHDLMDEVAEQQDVANEISDAISSGIGFGNDIDEDELMTELEELEQEDLDEKILQIDTPPADSLPADSLPSVPTSEPAAASRTTTKAAADDDDLRELELWAS